MWCAHVARACTLCAVCKSSSDHSIFGKFGPNHRTNGATSHRELVSRSAATTAVWFSVVGRWRLIAQILTAL